MLNGLSQESQSSWTTCLGWHNLVHTRTWEHSGILERVPGVERSTGKEIGAENWWHHVVDGTSVSSSELTAVCWDASQRNWKNCLLYSSIPVALWSYFLLSSSCHYSFCILNVVFPSSFWISLKGSEGISWEYWRRYWILMGWFSAYLQNSWWGTVWK